MGVHNYSLLLVIKDFGGSCDPRLALERNASMQGVGTKVGTCREFDDPG